MRLVLAMVFALVLAASAHAQTQSFYLHHSDVPVAIPGGTTSSFLDGQFPTATLATAEQRTVAAGASAAFPTFTATAFGTDTTLLPIASVQLLLSANQKIRGCAAVAADLFKVDGSGGLTPIGNGTISGATILQGKSEGTIATNGQRIEFPVTDPAILTGQGIAVATTFTNQCSTNRRLFFSYDAIAAHAAVRFQCCLTTAAKCAETKTKTVGAQASCLLAAYSKAAAKSFPLPDPAAVGKCIAKLDGAFTKAEDRGDCPSSGDAPVVDALTLAFVHDIDDTLKPPAPPPNTKCQAGKIKLTGGLARCLLALDAKAAKVGEFLDPDPAGVQKCQGKFTAGFAKYDAKGECGISGDAPAIQAKVEAYVTDAATRLACPCP